MEYIVKTVKKIGIVICNYNKKNYLKVCIESVLANVLPKEQYDIIVVDNASQDGSVDMVVEEFGGQVILLQNKENLGGSGGFSRGMHYCLENHYTYIALLDNDTKIMPETIDNLYRHLEKSPETGVVGAKILQMDHPEVLQEMGAYIDWKDFTIFTPDKGKKNNTSLPDLVECDYVPACCCMTRSEIVGKIGGFDTQYFIYWDDMDWCIRVKKQGYKINVIGNAVVYHKMGAQNDDNTFKNYYFTRNRILFFLKYLYEDKMDDFIDSVVNELISINFFSYIKGQAKKAVSVNYALEDLMDGHLGKTEKYIFELPELNPFKQEKLDYNKPVLMISDNKSYFPGNIYKMLKKFFSRVDILDSNNAFVGIKNIHRIKTIQNTRYAYIFLVSKHILDNYKFPNQELKGRIFIVDGFLNVSPLEKISEIKNAFKYYKSIQNSIWLPMIKEKLLAQRINFLSK